MALFKQFRGNRADLDKVEKCDGHAYFCVDDGTFHIDYADVNGVLYRKQINAKEAETIAGMSVDEIKKSINYNDLIDKPTLVSTVNGVSPDENGNVEIANSGGGSGGGIIDVLELPTENINTSAVYRLMTATFVYEGSKEEHHTIYCVDELPEVGEPVTDLNRSSIVAYFNITSGTIHGYIDDTLSAGLGIPVGWYGEELFSAFEVAYGGVITDITESEGKGALCVLLERQMYLYDNGWCQVPFAYEKVPEFDIQWDGDMTGHTVLDMSMLGYDQGTYFVKVSDDVFTTDELVGWTFNVKYNDASTSDERTINEYDFDTTTWPGAFTVANWITVLHDTDALAAALGIPAGIYPNGVYFLLNEFAHVSRLVAPIKIIKIDEKFLPDIGVDGLAQVAYSGNYNDLYNRPNLSNYVTTSQLSNYVTTTKVETMISNAIGSAIGGSY